MQLFTVFVVVGVVAVGCSAVDSDRKLSQPRRPLTDDIKDLPTSDDTNSLATEGYDAFPGQFPYQARLFITAENISYAILSSGSLITPNYILTHADSLYTSMINYNNTHGYALLGYSSGSDTGREQRINFTESGIYVHPLYTGSLCDIATIRLDHPVTFNRFVQPIRLPRLSDTRTYERMEGTTVGDKYNGTLRYLRNQVMLNPDCQELHPHAFIHAQHICTNTYIGGAFCNSMYGAGLVVKDDGGPVLVGVTNLIYWCGTNYPIVYERVSELREWIAENSDYVFDF
ncbi:collagenase-like [Anopheles maculipalpis]|uniref:collagenase-like n=1 Tax=Anopheles maculipalpis TaxID=1496333 RepID=UPI002158DD46|nr:collagenase-like [Anopheles maculipalpis]